MSLTEEEILRYSRHLLLPGFGSQGQERLKAAKVLVVGAGGLGSPVLMYLAAAGVGTLGVADADVVDTTNLQRQILHSTTDVGRTKVSSAEETLSALNPLVTIEAHDTRLEPDNALELIEPYDVVVDGVDNFSSRYLLNDACVRAGKVLVEGGILRFRGLVMSIHGGRTACFRCAYEEPPPEGEVPTCSQAGVLGAVAGIVGTIQAAEVLKIVTGLGEPLFGRLLQLDAAGMTFHEVAIPRRADCPGCGPAAASRPLEACALSCDAARRQEA